MFWSIMAPPGSSSSSPMGALKGKIEADFGSFDEMKAKFNAGAAARFGSGWQWLSLGADGKLFLSSTPNQNNPLMAGVEQAGIPIVGLDVWEHACTSDYPLTAVHSRAFTYSPDTNFIHFPHVSIFCRLPQVPEPPYVKGSSYSCLP
jgi:superoxide dismutase